MAKRRRKPKSPALSPDTSTAPIPVSLRVSPWSCCSLRRTKFTPNEEPTPSPTARTALDGSFHFPKVKPGTYYLLAEYAGDVSPIAKVPSIGVDTSDQAVVESLEKVLNKVTVAANKESTAEIELERGGAVAGTIHYDDGSPANGVEVSILRQEKDGKLAPVTLQLADRMGIVNPRTVAQTDDKGYFRISGLPAGKYVAETTFPTTSVSYGGLFGGPSIVNIRNNESTALKVYSGNVFRSKDAKVVELVAGEERDGADITIPLLGLHSISGSILALSDGHPISSAKILLLYADDTTTLRISILTRMVVSASYIFRKASIFCASPMQPTP
jgi:hypothetical protein